MRQNHLRAAEAALGRLFVAFSLVYDVSRNGETFLSGRNSHLDFGDLALTAKRRLLGQTGPWPSLAGRVAAKLPTGDEDTAHGSGEADLALGLAADWQFSRCAVSANFNTTFPMGNRLGDYGLDTRPMPSGNIEFEYRTSPKFSWHLQFAGTTSALDLATGRDPTPFDTARPEALVGEIFQFSPAVAWRPRPHLKLFFGFVEDFLAGENAAVDLTLFVTVDYRFGRAT